jgi:hypothetical protein
MTVKRGEIWLANLDPSRGSEQAGFRLCPAKGRLLMRVNALTQVHVDQVLIRNS